MNLESLSDEELDQEIRHARSQRNFSRLSVQLIEVALQRSEGIIRETLDRFQEHVPEPEPNPHRFIGYIKHDKNAYVSAYDRLKPTRDLVRLLRTFLPDMRNMRDTMQERYEALLRQLEIRKLQRQVLESTKKPPSNKDKENDDSDKPANDPDSGNSIRCANCAC